jgi:Flp pilus assembly pilin Flp
MQAWRKFSSLRDCFSDRSGTTAIEYALLASLIFLAIVATVQALGPRVAALFTAVSTAF